MNLNSSKDEYRAFIWSTTVLIILLQCTLIMSLRLNRYIFGSLNSDSCIDSIFFP
uniref:Uncharacterized protein n=1 Tax=Octopus bimaculoides TaxID=37653 RepID=A0A0L8G1J7_OCTBM